MSPSDHRGARWRHTVFIAYVVVMVAVFLLPVPATPLEESTHVDKVVHFGIFLGFALLFYIDRASRTRWTLLASFAFAAAIEVVQWVVPYREGDWWDFVAGAAGACVGAALLLLIERRRSPPPRPAS
jgi:VanZ family protein